MKTILKYKTRDGSAMIIAIMVAAMISTMVIGAGRLVTNEVKINSRYRDEQVAYYAAEAGIEKGLALIKANPNPYNSRTNSSLPIETDTPLGNSITYDLSIWRLAPSPTYAIDKDQTIELNKVMGRQSLPPDIRYDPDNSSVDNPDNATCPLPEKVCVYLEVTQYPDSLVSLNQTPIAQKLLGTELSGNIIVNNTSCAGGWRAELPLIIDAQTKTIRLRPYVTQYKLPERLNISNLDLQQSVQKAILGPYSTPNQKLSPPADCKYHLSFTTETHSVDVDQSYISIRSVGKYRQVKKVLEAKLSGMSNQALEIFDYVIYAGEKLDVK